MGTNGRKVGRRRINKKGEGGTRQKGLGRRERWRWGYGRTRESLGRLGKGTRRLLRSCLNLGR